MDDGDLLRWPDIQELMSVLCIAHDPIHSASILGSVLLPLPYSDGPVVTDRPGIRYAALDRLSWLPY